MANVNDSQTNGTTLLHCPFCGSEAFLVSGEEFGETYTEVSCTSCNATISKLGAEAIEPGTHALIMPYKPRMSASSTASQ